MSWAVHLSIVLGVAWLQRRWVRPRLESPGTRERQFGAHNLAISFHINRMPAVRANVVKAK
jgi:hypothetical protein